MTERSLLEEVRAVTRRLDEQGVLHQEAVAYERAVARQGYLHALLGQLALELGTLRAAAGLLVMCFSDDKGEAVWRRCCAELRCAPRAFRTPGQALIADDLDLLQLVQYTAAATATYRERRHQLVSELDRALAASPSDAHADLRAALAEEDSAGLVACWAARQAAAGSVGQSPPRPA